MPGFGYGRVASVAGRALFAPGALLAYDFKTPRFRTPAIFTTSDVTAVPGHSYTRSGTATAPNADGTHTSFAANVVRRTNVGAPIAEGRTNSIRNNTGVGAVAGTPGTNPTNWFLSQPAGVSRTLVGNGTENGLPYVEWAFSGTASAAGSIIVQFESSTAIVAASGQAWAASAYHRLAGGAVPGAVWVVISENDAAGTFLTGNTYAVAAPTGSMTRAEATRTLTNASTARLVSQMRYDVANGQAVNFTLRVYAPQLEQGAFATSPILTTNAAVTRGPDALANTGLNLASGANFLMHGAVVMNAYDAANQRVVELHDGTDNNKLQLFRSSGAAVALQTIVGGATTTSTTSAKAGARTLKYAVRRTGLVYTLFADMASIGSITPAAMPTLTGEAFGMSRSGANHLNGILESNVIRLGTFSDAEAIALMA